MTEHNRRDDPIRSAWLTALQRLREVEVEPALTMARVDALHEALGPRPEGRDLRSWLQMGASAAPAQNATGSAPRRYRLRPVSEFLRLAAATDPLALPALDLESGDGRFRLRASSDGERVTLDLAALGFASEEFAGRTVALVSANDPAAAAALLALDDDGDGQNSFPDTPDLRRALLRPLVALVEED